MNFLKGFVLFLISLILSLFLIEVLLGVVGYKIKEHNWRWEVSNKYAGFVLDKDRIWSLNKDLYDDGGFRYNPDHDGIDFEDKSLRKIVILGDSATFGVGVSDNETYPYFLEKRLKEKSKDGKIIVHNAGVSGYGVDQEFINLRDDILPDVRPDLVVWAINVNDVIDSNSACLFKKKGGSFYQIPAYYNFLYLQGLADRIFPDFVIESKSYNLFISAMSKFFAGSTDENRFTFGCTIKDMKNDKEVDEMVYAKIKNLLSQAKQLSYNYNIKIILTLVPFQEYFDKTVSNEVFTNYYSRMIGVLSSSNFEFVDTNAEILKSVDKDFYEYRAGIKSEYKNNGKEWNKLLFMGNEDVTGYGWRHPNVNGYKAVVDVLGDFLDNHN